MAKMVDAEPFQRISSAAYIDDIGTRLEALPHDDAAFDQWMMHHVADYVHASSSCRMGGVSDEFAVVDVDCAVHHHQGLRVCDASVFPDLPRGNTHLPTVMVAERLAERLGAKAQ